MTATLSAEKRDIFETMPVRKAVATLAVPTIISQMIALVYNLGDTFFVGQTNDPNQVAAVALAFPAMLCVTALTNLFGIGGGSLISRSLGERNYERAKRASTFCIYTAVAAVLVYSLLFYFLREWVVDLLGASAETRAFALDYLFYTVVVGGVPSLLNILFGHLVRAEGGARQASIGMSLGGILNLILDPIFILPFGLGLEVKGAAIATMLSNVAATAYFLVYLYRKRGHTVISLHPRDYCAKAGIVKPVLLIGLPASLQTVLVVLSHGVLNKLITAYSDTALAAAGIVKKIDHLPLNVSMGISQGVLPLVAYNYASGNHQRMHEINRFARTVAMGFAFLCVAVFELFAPSIVRLFIQDAQTVAYGAVFLRILCISTPFMGFCLLITSLFQATGQSRQALTMSIFRKGLEIPVFFLMDRLVPLYGLIMTQPIIDLLGVFLALALYGGFRRRLAENVGVTKL